MQRSLAVDACEPPPRSGQAGWRELGGFDAMVARAAEHREPRIARKGGIDRGKLAEVEGGAGARLDDPHVDAALAEPDGRGWRKGHRAATGRRRRPSTAHS